MRFRLGDNRKGATNPLSIFLIIPLLNVTTAAPINTNVVVVPSCAVIPMVTFTTTTTVSFHAETTSQPTTQVTADSRPLSTGTISILTHLEDLTTHVSEEVVALTLTRAKSTVSENATTTPKSLTEVKSTESANGTTSETATISLKPSTTQESTAKAKAKPSTKVLTKVITMNRTKSIIIIQSTSKSKATKATTKLQPAASPAHLTITPGTTLVTSTTTATSSIFNTTEVVKSKAQSFLDAQVPTTSAASATQQNSQLSPEQSSQISSVLNEHYSKYPQPTHEPPKTCDCQKCCECCKTCDCDKVEPKPINRYNSTGGPPDYNFWYVDETWKRMRDLHILRVSAWAIVTPAVKPTIPKTDYECDALMIYKYKSERVITDIERPLPRPENDVEWISDMKISYWRVGTFRLAGRGPDATIAWDKLKPAWYLHMEAQAQYGKQNSPYWNQTLWDERIAGNPGPSWVAPTIEEANALKNAKPLVQTRAEISEEKDKALEERAWAQHLDSLAVPMIRKPFPNVPHEDMKIPQGEVPVDIYRKPFANLPGLWKHNKRDETASTLQATPVEHSAQSESTGLAAPIYRKPYPNVHGEMDEVPKGENPVSIYRKPFVNLPSAISKAKRDAEAIVDHVHSFFKRKNYNTHDRRFTLLNATPYKWKRQNMHQYQMADWNETMWPKYILPGEAISTLSQASEGHYQHDTGGEVVYTLEDAPEAGAGFTVVYNPHRNKEPIVEVHFRGGLKTRYSKRLSKIDLGGRVRHGGVQFVLAGEYNDLISNDTPVRWMQASLPEVGHYPLNEITMPRSHHPGMYKSQEDLWTYPSVTVTQRLDVFDQLKDGARILDYRPIKRREARGFAESHLTNLQGGIMGSIGAQLQDIIQQINDFNKKYPGELIMIDIHDSDNWDEGLYFDRLNVKARTLLYKELSKLKYRFDASAHPFLHKLPLNTYIQSGHPAVLIHCPDSWGKDPAFPGEAEGFTTNLRFPRVNHWTNTDNPLTLSKNQRIELAASKPRDTRIYDMQYILNLLGAMNLAPGMGLKPRSKIVWGRLFKSVWKSCLPGVDGKKARVPNWITIDGFDGTGDLRHLVMVMNKCLVAGKCGKLEGLWRMKNGPSDASIKEAKLKSGDGDVDEFDPKWEPWDRHV